MADPQQTLRARLADAGRRLGEREAAHRGELDAARGRAEDLRSWVAGGLESFHAAAAEVGAPHLQVELEAARIDDKHLRSVQFGISRGRTRGIVTVKSKGQVTLVGPFKSGGTEGPCQSFPVDADEEIALALGDFLERFLEEAATP